MEQQKRNNNKIVDGRMMQGIVYQWLLDNTDLTLEELGIIAVVLRETLGRRKAFAFIKRENFLRFMSRNTLSKYRKSLVDRGIISCKTTKAYTMYSILEPSEEISNFLLGKSSGSEEKPIREFDSSGW